MGRASTFSDPRVIATLQRNFIPVAINVAHLVPEDTERRNWGESSRFVEAIVRQSGMRTRQGGDAQGYYASLPQGTSTEASTLTTSTGSSSCSTAPAGGSRPTRPSRCR